MFHPIQGHIEWMSWSGGFWIKWDHSMTLFSAHGFLTEWNQVTPVKQAIDTNAWAA
jgi:hypothetical protein